MVVVLDDMEDGDGAACDKTSRWLIKGTGTLSPMLGPVVRATDLDGDDLTARMPSLRALHLSGTVEPGAWASLFLALDGEDLSSFEEIQVWARSDSGSLVLRANVATAATTELGQGGRCDPALGDCGDHYGDYPFELSETWGGTGNPNSIALTGISQAGVGQPVPRDFSETVGIEFRVTAPASTALGFGFWIDDVQLKRPPTQ